MKGFKVTNPDYTCRGFKFEVGQDYKIKGTLKICSNGFHFCQRAADCFNYYSFDANNKVFEVEALGQVFTEEDKSVTDHIKIVREISWQEVLDTVNTGKGNTGIGNSGNRNSGDSNSGNRNSGNWNSGNWNSGDSNSGNWNSGDRNSGDRNSGDRNSGNWNSGDRNSGNWNSGDRNSGDRNSGDFNKTNFSSGVFCTEEPKCLIFDKPSNMTLRDWRNSDAYRILYYRYENTKWIDSSEMTEQEKHDHSYHEVTGGYLKVMSETEAWQNLWDNLDDCEKKIIKGIPNFDATKFYKITGITV